MGQITMTVERKPASQSVLLLSSDFIVNRFFSFEENLNLLDVYCKNQTWENWDLLIEAFSKFYFNVKFTKYISSTIKFAYIDYVRRKNSRNSKNLVIFDSNLFEEDSDMTLGSVHPQSPYSVDDLLDQNSKDFLQSITDKSIYEAYSRLTKNQKTILTLTYIGQYLDKEIAAKLSVTPQAVSKTRNLALENLRKRLAAVNFKIEKERIG